MVRFIAYPLRNNKDFVLAHLKTDITREVKRDTPCFQFSAFLPGEQATKHDLKELLAAVVRAGDWADEITKGLSDHYPAHHEFVQTICIKKRNGDVFIPLSKTAKPGITLTKSGEVQIPRLWFTEGTTQVYWGDFEAAIKLALSL